MASQGYGQDQSVPLSSPRVELIVAWRKIAELRPNSKNSRIHNRRQRRQIARSIRLFGFCVPILIDGNDRVIAGHGRLMAAEDLGMTEVPTICLDHLSDAQAKALMLADNKLAENASWDDRLLAEALKELSQLDLDFDLEATGFEMGEIDLRIEGLNIPAEGPDPADLIPNPAAGAAVTRAGDLWLLGEHRIRCGSALDSASYSALMNAERAAMVFTDHPYNLRIEGHVSGLGAIHHREFAMATGEMSEVQYTDFLTRSCSLLARYSAAGSLHFVCIDWRHVRELLAAGRAAYKELVNLCVWVKHNAGMGSLYRSQYELVLVFKSSRGRHRNNVELGRNGRSRSNVWQYPAINDFGRAGEEGNLLALHPTVKPVAMVADAIMDCTARGDIVLDGFLGSGTTVIAAQRTGRRCYGLEIDPLYVDTAVRRWQIFTRERARHAEAGCSFEELANTRMAHHDQ